MMAFIWGLWAAWKASLIKWAIYAAAVLSFVATIWFKGYSASQRRFKQRQKDAKLKQLESKRKINETVTHLNDRCLDDALSRWMRD